ncbi:hypothetical protein ACA910_001073 [Epithemia clementina (nom. ined.)]
MQDAWNHGMDDDHDQDQMIEESRSSLGLFIERSTSAPPASSSGVASDLGGFRLLSHVSESSHHREGSISDRSLFPPPSSFVKSQAATPVIGNHRYGSNSAIENDSFRAAMLSSMIDNSGRATAPSATESFLSSANTPRVGEREAHEPMRFGFGSSGTEGIPSPLGHSPFQRSHSAAPPSPSLAPPPGMPALGVGGDRRGGLSVQHLPATDVIRRPASTGLLDSSALRPSEKALRPSAKTLMDWIQEDYPQDDAPRYSNETVSLSDQFDLPPSFNDNQQLYNQQKHSSLGAQSPQYLPSRQTQHSLTDQLQQQVQRLRFDSNGGATGQIQQTGSVGHIDSSQSFAQQHNISQQVMAQRYVPTGFEGRESAKPDAPSLLFRPNTRPQQAQLQPQQPQQVYITTPGRPQGTIVSQDNMYYQQQIEVASPPSRLRAQVLPDGQTVYIQEPSPHSQQPPGSYTYTTIQYHPQAGHMTPEQTSQQTRIVSTAPASLIRQSDGSYISAVPVQSGNSGQITYWPADVASQGQTLIVGTQPGVTSHMPQTVSVSHAQSPQQLTSVMEHHLSPGHQQRHAQSHSGRGGRERSGGSTMGGGSGGRSRRGGHQSRRAETKGHPTSSPLLEEFRTNKNRQWTVPQIEGHIVEFCQDQNGSRFIQQRLELGDSLEQDVVVREVLPSIRRLRNDVFGNYVVQKLLDFGSPQVRASIRDTLEGEMLQLSLQMYGCRVVQKALEALDFDDLARLLLEFHHNVLSCIHDQNGNHVIQKCIEVMNTRARSAETNGDEAKARHSRELIDFIINDVLVNATTLSCHPFGCRVLQRILEHSDEDRKNKLLDQVQKSHKRLLDDQYGNYVIQHVLEYGRVEDRDSILAIVVQSGLLSLSRQKFASNVVEKLLKYGNGPQRKAIAREMLKRADNSSGMNIHGGDSSVVLLMVRDAYANYVVQTTLDVVPDSEERTSLLNELDSHSDELRNYTFAKHIVAKLTSLDEAK